MRYYQVDVIKSITNEKLCMRQSPWKELGLWISSLFLTLPMPLILSILIPKSLKESDFYISALQIVLMVIMFFTVWILLMALIARTQYKIIRCNVNDQSISRKIILQFAKRKRCTIHANHHNLISIEPDWKWYQLLNSGEEVIILMHKNHTYVNCTTYLRDGIISPFHWYVNRQHEKQIASELSAFASENRKSSDL